MFRKIEKSHKSSSKIDIDPKTSPSDTVGVFLERPLAEINFRLVVYRYSRRSRDFSSAKVFVTGENVFSYESSQPERKMPSFAPDIRRGTLKQRINVAIDWNGTT